MWKRVLTTHMGGVRDVRDEPMNVDTGPWPTSKLSHIYFSSNVDRYSNCSKSM